MEGVGKCGGGVEKCGGGVEKCGGSVLGYGRSEERCRGCGILSPHFPTSQQPTHFTKPLSTTPHF